MLEQEHQLGDRLFICNATRTPILNGEECMVVLPLKVRKVRTYDEPIAVYGVTLIEEGLMPYGIIAVRPDQLQIV